MGVYFALAGFALVAGRLASKAKKMTTRAALIAAVCFAFCLVAGARSLEVGTDTSIYPYRLFRQSLNSAFSPTFSHYISTVEPLYIVLAWLVTRATSSFTALLFATQAFAVVPLAIVTWRLAPKYFGDGMMLYALLLFPYTLNIARQAISVAFLILAFAYLMKNKRWQFVICVAVATGFHLTGVLGLLLWPVVGMSGRDNASKRNGQLRIVAFCLLAIFVLMAIVFSDSIIDLMSGVKSTYARQGQYLREGEGGVNMSYLAFVVLMLLYSGSVLSASEANGRSFAICDSLRYLLIISCFFSLFSVLSYSLFRLGFMWSMFASPLYAYALGLESDSRARRVAMSISVIVLSVFFYFYYVRGGAGSVVPYEIAFL